MKPFLAVPLVILAGCLDFDISHPEHFQHDPNLGTSSYREIVGDGFASGWFAMDYRTGDEPPLLGVDGWYQPGLDAALAPPPRKLPAPSPGNSRIWRRVGQGQALNVLFANGTAVAAAPPSRPDSSDPQRPIVLEYEHCWDGNCIPWWEAVDGEEFWCLSNEGLKIRPPGCNGYIVRTYWGLSFAGAGEPHYAENF